MNMKKCLHLRISGKVQGVYFRASTKEKAEALGILGVVINAADGNVHVEAEGEEENLREFVEWCWQGPPRAVVKHVEAKEGPLKNFSKFEILR